MTINSINLQSPYLTQSIEPSAFKTALGSTYQTAYRLYLITNQIEELQHFIEVKHPEVWVTATVKTEAALAGRAKRQAWAVSHLTPLLRKKPRYILKCNVTLKSTNQEIYRCDLVSINPSTIYKQIQDCINDIKLLLDEKNY